MDLRLGKIEINGILFEKDIGMDEVIKNSQFRACANIDGKVALFNSKQTNVEGYIFIVKVFFFDKRLYKIKMTPILIGMEEPNYPDKKHQEEKKKVCDSFLKKHLGNPLEETETVLFYEFDWGSICSVSFLRGHSAYTGGFIDIKYNKRKV